MYGKKNVDIIFSFLIILLLFWLIILLWLISTIVFKKNGFFLQKRVGKNKRIFLIIKIRSLSNENNTNPSKFGDFIRGSKLDEIPQFINVLIGQMSIVGPRPELESYFVNNDYPEDLLKLKPGVTGLASLYFINEASIKNNCINKHIFDRWMFLRKKKLNTIYLNNMSFCFDLKIIYLTIRRILFN